MHPRWSSTRGRLFFDSSADVPRPLEQGVLDVRMLLERLQLLLLQQFSYCILRRSKPCIPGLQLKDFFFVFRRLFRAHSFERPISVRRLDALFKLHFGQDRKGPGARVIGIQGLAPCGLDLQAVQDFPQLLDFVSGNVRVALHDVQMRAVRRMRTQQFRQFAVGPGRFAHLDCAETALLGHGALLPLSDQGVRHVAESPCHEHHQCGTARQAHRMSQHLRNATGVGWHLGRDPRRSWWRAGADYWWGSLVVLP